MGLSVHLAMVGWLPATLLLFAVMPPRRAVVWAFVAGWLLLPRWHYAMPIIPDYTRWAAVSVPVLLGCTLFASSDLSRLRPSLYDVPMIVYCLAPIGTALRNGLGFETGLSHVITECFVWGFPYVIGRAYLGSQQGVRDLAIGIFAGGLAYVPLVLFEVRMSPQLHRLVYGYFQASFAQHVRYGGFRPIVFMQHGLMVAMWMTAATICGLWLWRMGGLKRFLGVHMKVWVPLLAVTTLLCRSGNALVLGLLGGLTYLAYAYRPKPLIILVLALLAPTYVSIRAAGLWSGDGLVDLIETFDKERGGSLGIRMYQEVVYTRQAWKRPLFGWGGPGMIPRDENGERMTRGNDSYWIITLGLHGLLSLAGIMVTFVMPALSLYRLRRLGQLPPWTLAPALALTTVSALFAIDCTLNAMITPVYTLGMGAVVGLAVTMRDSASCGQASRCARDTDATPSVVGAPG